MVIGMLTHAHHYWYAFVLHNVIGISDIINGPGLQHEMVEVATLERTERRHHCQRVVPWVAVEKRYVKVIIALVPDNVVRDTKTEHISIKLDARSVILYLSLIHI